MKEYLGDSVYAETDQFGDIILTTNNGLGPTNKIILDPVVFHTLARFAKKYYDSVVEERRAHSHGEQP